MSPSEFTHPLNSKLQKDRGAILTTHSMEEADALCNRVGIMVKGELRSDSVKSARFALEIRAFYFG